MTFDANIAGKYFWNILCWLTIESDLWKNCRTLDFRKRTIPPPAPKITLKNLHLSARKSHPWSNFHISTWTEGNRSMKIFGAPSLMATYKALMRCDSKKWWLTGERKHSATPNYGAGTSFISPSSQPHHLQRTLQKQFCQALLRGAVHDAFVSRCSVSGSLPDTRLLGYPVRFRPTAWYSHKL